MGSSTKKYSNNGVSQVQNAFGYSGNKTNSSSSSSGTKVNANQVQSHFGYSGNKSNSGTNSNGYSTNNGTSQVQSTFSYTGNPSSSSSSSSSGATRTYTNPTTNTITNTATAQPQNTFTYSNSAKLLAENAAAAERARVAAEVEKAKALIEQNKQNILNKTALAEQNKAMAEIQNQAKISAAKATEEQRIKTILAQGLKSAKANSQNKNKDTEKTTLDTIKERLTDIFNPESKASTSSTLTNIDQQNLNRNYGVKERAAYNDTMATPGYTSAQDFWDKNKYGMAVAAGVPAAMALGGLAIPAVGNAIGNVALGGLGSISNKALATKALTAASTGTVGDKILNLSQPSISNITGFDNALNNTLSTAEQLAPIYANQASDFINNNIPSILGGTAVLGGLTSAAALSANSDQAKTAPAITDERTNGQILLDSLKYFNPSNPDNNLNTGLRELKAAFDTLGEPTPETAWDKINKAQAAEKAARAAETKQIAADARAEKAAKAAAAATTVPTGGTTGSGTGVGSTDTGTGKQKQTTNPGITTTQGDEGASGNLLESSETTYGTGSDVEAAINQMRSNYGITGLDYDSLLQQYLGSINDAMGTVRNENDLLLAGIADNKSNFLNNVYKAYTDAIGSGLTSGASTGWAAANALQAVQSQAQEEASTEESIRKQALANILEIAKKKSDAPTTVSGLIAQLMTPESEIRKSYFQESDAASKNAAASNYAADVAADAAIQSAALQAAAYGSGSNSSSNNVMTQQQMYDYIDSATDLSDLKYKLSTISGLTQGDDLYEDLFNRGKSKISARNAIKVNADQVQSHFGY